MLHLQLPEALWPCNTGCNATLVISGRTNNPESGQRMMIDDNDDSAVEYSSVGDAEAGTRKNMEGAPSGA